MRSNASDQTPIVSLPDAPQTIADDDLAVIIDRAARLGIPAWRVTTALGLAVSACQPSPTTSEGDSS